MNFERITISDKSLIERFVANVGEDNCETAYINLLVWQDLYDVSFCATEDSLIIKESSTEEETFTLPFGDLVRGIERLLKYTGGKHPIFRAQEGPRLDEFTRIMGDKYDIVELDEDEDYIYRRQDLSDLVGKKYHSKRNHISAFSRLYRWNYEPIDANNLADVQKCAERWYAENAERLNPELRAERQGMQLFFDNFESLGLFGEAIRVDDEIIAFCIASQLNENVVDVHVEKALSGYDGAYAVINNEFAKHLPTEIEFINREDDMGAEGLRKAKLSYHPAKLLKKYLCLPREVDEVRNIYTEAFGSSPQFDALFFYNYRSAARSLVVDGKIVSILFLLPCSADENNFYYLYAAATAAAERGKGYMSRLIKETLSSIDAPVFLKPATDDLVAFYSKLGFHLAKGVARNGDVKISVSDAHKRLNDLCDDCPDSFALMFNIETPDLSFEFPYIMQ